ALGRRPEPWASALSRQLLDPRQLDQLAAERPRPTRIPPGDPIGDGDGEWMDFY
ncbi:MAG: peptidase, partial [Alphaproteobacteria bacterium]|nr:peptidase [Alphaproteobacteria bacterium]